MAGGSPVLGGQAADHGAIRGTAQYGGRLKDVGGAQPEKSAMICDGREIITELYPPKSDCDI